MVGQATKSCGGRKILTPFTMNFVAGYAMNAGASSLFLGINLVEIGTVGKVRFVSFFPAAKRFVYGESF